MQPPQVQQQQQQPQAIVSDNQPQSQQATNQGPQYLNNENKPLEEGEGGEGEGEGEGEKNALSIRWLPTTIITLILLCGVGLFWWLCKGTGDLHTKKYKFSMSKGISKYDRVSGIDDGNSKGLTSDTDDGDGEGEGEENI